MASHPKYVRRDLKKKTPDQITIAGPVTRQQHKLSQCVVAKIQAKYTTVDGPAYWDNFQQTFAKYKTESEVKAGLKAHDFILERIIPRPQRKPILEFRVRNEQQLDTLERGVANKSLANLILDYMIPEDDRRHTDVLVLSFETESHCEELEEKLEQIKGNSDENYRIYLASRRVGVIEDDVSALSQPEN